MVARTVVRSVGQHLHPVGPLTIRNMVNNPDLLLDQGTNTIVRRNLVPNPSFETSTANWTTDHTGSTFTRDTSTAYVGSASMRVVGNPASTSSYKQNVYLNPITVSLPAGTAMRWTIALKGAVGGEHILIKPVLNAGATSTPGSTVVLTTSWQVFTIDIIAPATVVSAYIILGDTVDASAVTFWVDAVGIFPDQAGGYFDGSTTDTSTEQYAWVSTANLSASTKSQLNISNFTVNSASFTRDTSTNKYGVNSGRVDIAAVGVQSSIVQTFAVSELQDYTASMWVNVPVDLSTSLSIIAKLYASDGTEVPLYDEDGNPIDYLGDVVLNGDATNGWVRTSILLSTVPSAATMDVYFVYTTTAPTVLDYFYVDALQLEPTDTAGPFVHGDMSGYVWVGDEWLSYTLESQVPQALATFEIGALHGAVGGMIAHGTLTPPNILPLQS